MTSVHRPGIAVCALSVACLFVSAPLQAQAPSAADLQKRANAILTLMGFSLTPDVTTGALSFSDQSTGDPYFRHRCTLKARWRTVATIRLSPQPAPRLRFR
jgi:hypothetical protein